MQNINKLKILSFHNSLECSVVYFENGIIKEAIKDAILEGEIPNENKAAFERMKEEGNKLGLTPHEKSI